MDLRTGAAFWMIKNGLLHAYPPLSSDETADVAIVGAGITGALAACELTTAGANIVVLDRRDVASGSSAASTGLLQCETDWLLQELAETHGLATGVRAYQLGLRAIDHIERLCEEIGDPCSFSRRASLYLASTRRDGAVLAREHALRVANGFDVDLLTSREIESRFGFEAPAALYSRAAGQVDCYRLTHGLLGKAAEAGARIYDRTEVLGVSRNTTGVELETDRGFRVRARRVICAAGYESVEGLPRGKSARRIRSLTTLNSTWACATEPVDRVGGWEDRCLIWETARPYFYLRTTDDGRVVMGGEDSPFSRRHESTRLLEKKSAALLGRFHQMFPDTPVEPSHSWAGVFAETRDGLPCIGPIPNDPDVWYALGYGGNGITFGVIAAALLRDAWMGTPSPDADMFSFARPSLSA